MRIDQITEKWSQKYKRSIDCSNPKGFSQKAHCAGRKKKKSESICESYEIEFVCVNPNFCDATEQKNQDKLFQALRAVPGIIVYKQDFDAHNSMAAIIKDEADTDAPKLIKKLAQQHKVAIDLENDVSQGMMDDIVSGRLEGLTDYYDTDRKKKTNEDADFYNQWDHDYPVEYSKYLEKTFGAPDEITNEQTVWHNKDGFKRIVCRDEYILHGSPAPHYDFVYCYIDLEVPEDLSDELAKCSGSILIDHLKNEVGARCGSLTANAVTLNFVLDVVAGRAEPVKEEYEQRILQMQDMFEKGEIYSNDWWEDNAGDANPKNPFYAESVNEDLRAWFGKGKKGGAGGGGWDRYNTKGERIGKCGDAKPNEGKPKCLSKSRAASLRAKGGKAAIAAAVKKKRREDPNKNRRGKAKNVSNTVKKRKK